MKRDKDLRNTKGNDLADRREAAAKAKAALLEAHRARVEAAEPTRLARQEERLAIAAAREERLAEREKAKRAAQEEARIAAEAAERQAAIDAAAKAEVEAREKADNRISRVIADEAARKAEGWSAQTGHAETLVLLSRA